MPSSGELLNSGIEPISFHVSCIDRRVLYHHLESPMNSIETRVLSSVKQITSPGWMHETSAQGWCTGKTQRDLVEKEVGGGIRMGNTCKPMADSCQCMTKTTTIL